jgi:hypothetical protein
VVLVREVRDAAPAEADHALVVAAPAIAGRGRELAAISAALSRFQRYGAVVYLVGVLGRVAGGAV